MKSPPGRTGFFSNPPSPSTYSACPRCEGGRKRYLYHGQLKKKGSVNQGLREEWIFAKQLASSAIVTLGH